MGKFKTQPVVSKSEPQKDMSKFYVISRLANKGTRDKLDLGDAWTDKIIFYDEQQAVQEYVWLANHQNLREFMLIKVQDNLNDSLEGLV